MKKNQIIKYCTSFTSVVAIILLTLAYLPKQKTTDVGIDTTPLKYMNMTISELQKAVKINPASIHNNEDERYGTTYEDIIRQLGYTKPLSEQDMQENKIYDAGVKLIIDTKKSLLGRQVTTALRYDTPTDTVMGVDYYLLFQNSTDKDYSYMQSVYDHLKSSYIVEADKSPENEINQNIITKDRSIEAQLTTDIKVNDIAYKPFEPVTFQGRTYQFREDIHARFSIDRFAEDSVIMQLKLLPVVNLDL